MAPATPFTFTGTDEGRVTEANSAERGAPAIRTTVVHEIGARNVVGIADDVARYSSSTVACSDKGSIVAGI